jgi:hypothetical protein
MFSRKCWYTIDAISNLYMYVQWQIPFALKMRNAGYDMHDGSTKVCAIDQAMRFHKSVQERRKRTEMITNPALGTQSQAFPRRKLLINESREGKVTIVRKGM